MLNLIVKDVKNILYDVKTLAIILLMPVILMSILGSALKGVFTEDSSGIINTHIAVVKEYDYEFELDKYKGQIAPYKDLIGTGELDITSTFDPEKLFFDILGSKDIREMVTYEIVTREEGEKLIEENEISAMIVLPKDYVYNSLMSMTMARNVFAFETIKNSEKQFEADNAVEQIMNMVANNMNKMFANRMVLMENINALGLGLENMDIMSELPGNGEQIDIPITEKEVSGKNALNSYQYYAAAIMTMFLLYAASLGGKALLDEKKEFTLQRLEVFGNKLSKLAFSNFIRVMLISIIQSLVMIGYTTFVLKVQWGDMATVALTVLLCSLAVGTLGALVSVITLVTDKYFVANAFEFAVVQLMALVGGSFIPVEMLPKPLQSLNIFAINGNAIKMFQNGMAEVPIGENRTYIIALLTMSVVFSLCAWIVLKTKKGGVIA